MLQWLLAMLNRPKKTKLPKNSSGCYLDGMRAYYRGFKLEDNPYRKHSPSHSIWRDDWLDAAGRLNYTLP